MGDRLGVVASSQYARRWGLASASVWGAVVGVVVFSAAHPTTLLGVFTRHFFSRFCHQNPERSFLLFGESLCVCHRCAGIYVGLLLGSLLAAIGLRVTPDSRRAWLLAAAPMAAHVALLQFFPLVDVVWLRVATGLVLGTWATLALVWAVASLGAPSSVHLSQSPDC